MQLFSLFDRKMREYGQIVQANNAEACKRALCDGVRGTKSLVEKHPDDFDLYRLGEFDTDTGVIKATGVPVLVCNVGELINVAVE